MEIKESLSLALLALRRNKIRSFLTMLGIIIGVFAVITLVSLGTGLKYYITKQFESLGSNILYVMPGQVGGESGAELGQGPPNFSGSKLKPSYIKDIQKLGYPILRVTGDIEVPAEARYQNKQKRVTVVGGSEEIFSMTSSSAESGRLFNSSEVSSGRKVAVIGPEVVKKLYPNKDPVNQEIIVADTRFKVIGVLESKGAGIMGGAADSTVYIPISVAQKLFGVENLQMIMVEFADKDSLEEAKYKVKTFLLRSLKEDDFSVLNQASILSTISSILGVLTMALGGIAAISLLVGGIGIMNIMLVSVTERTREIGIRKAIGAKRRDILSQFLVESAVVSIVGGVIGILLGLGFSQILSQIPMGTQTLKSIVSVDAVIMAFGVSAAIGLFFGIYPATRAARLHPIEALRYE